MIQILMDFPWSVAAALPHRAGRRGAVAQSAQLDGDDVDGRGEAGGNGWRMDGKSRALMMVIIMENPSNGILKVAYLI